jgi:biopolymer transport protein ExbD
MTTSHSDVSGPKKARVEIIPLIDVIFFLLATFVLFTLSLDKLRSIEVVLPVAPPPGPPPAGPDETLYLQASEHGTYYWKVGAKSAPEAITAAELGPRLDEYKRNVPRPRVFVRGDNRATLGAAVLALDAVRQAQIAEVSVETVPSSTGN